MDLPSHCHSFSSEPEPNAPIPKGAIRLNPKWPNMIVENGQMRHPTSHEANQGWYMPSSPDSRVNFDPLARGKNYGSFQEAIEDQDK